MTQNDNELAKRIKNGDQNTFKILYVRYSDLLFAYILHHLNKDKETTADIWQDTWAIAIEKIESFQHKSSIFTWLCGIAKNKISDHYRDTKNKEQFQQTEKLQVDIDSEELEIELADAETTADVINVLAELSDEYRFLLMAKYIENKNIDEISRVIDKSYKATESMLTRAREAFRKKFIKMVKS